MAGMSEIRKNLFHNSEITCPRTEPTTLRLTSATGLTLRKVSEVTLWSGLMYDFIRPLLTQYLFPLDEFNLQGLKLALFC